MIRVRVFYLLIAVLLLFAIVDVGVATWLLAPPVTRAYVVQPGETLADIATRFHVHPQAVAVENGLGPGVSVQPGQVLSVPTAPLGPFLHWRLQLVGLGATLLGGLLALWLCSANGILLARSGSLEAAVALTVALANYVTVQATATSLQEAITPAFVSTSIVQGFAWTALVPLLTKALRGPVEDR